MLTYGGEPLLIPDDDGELNDWLQHSYRLDESAFNGDMPAHLKSARYCRRDRAEPNKGIGLPVMNYPPDPPPRLNTLWWPTGATRWARGYFLATKEVKDRLTERVHQNSNTSPLDLAWGDDETDTPLLASMYMLPPRPISAVDPEAFGSDDTLWLIPLVDVRYFWQFIFTNNLLVSATSAGWPVIGDLFSALGIEFWVAGSITVGFSAPATGYGVPDPITFGCRYESAALLLDAACISTGRRLTRWPNGLVRLERPREAQAVVASNLGRSSSTTGSDIAPPIRAQKYALLAGGDYSNEEGDLPSSIIVTFRGLRQYEPLADGAQIAIDMQAPTDVGTTSGGSKTIRSTAFAAYNADNVLVNEASLNNYADLIRDDFYGWQSRKYDYTFIGAQPWHPCGFDDAVTFKFGALAEDGTRLATTRVCTLPQDVYPETNGIQYPLNSLGVAAYDLPPHAVASISPVAANDLYANTFLNQVMPRTTAVLYKTSQSGPLVGWQPIVASGLGFTIYNPKPFTYNGLVRVAKYGEHYLIEGAVPGANQAGPSNAFGTPYAEHTSASSGSGNGLGPIGGSNLVTWNGGSTAGGISTSSGEQITITCPVQNQKFRVRYSGFVQVKFAAAARVARWGHRCLLHGGSTAPTFPDVNEDQWTEDTALSAGALPSPPPTVFMSQTSSYPLRRNFSFERTMLLRFNDILSLESVVVGITEGGGSATVDEHHIAVNLIIEPLF